MDCTHRGSNLPVCVCAALRCGSSPRSQSAAGAQQGAALTGEGVSALISGKINNVAASENHGENARVE